jgi:hypothetical protein
MKTNKKGVNKILVSILVLVIIIAAASAIYYFFIRGTGEVGLEKTPVVSALRENYLIVKGYVLDWMGFDAGIADFFIDLLIGFLVGVWLTGVFWLASLEKFIFHKTLHRFSQGLNLKNTWLAFLGDSFWKIVPIAVFYAVVMQIPIINSVISVITLEPLLWFKSTLWGGILKSLILAFYIGFLPTMIEEFFKFKLRKRYYENVELERVGVAQQDIHARRR